MIKSQDSLERLASVALNKYAPYSERQAAMLVLAAASDVLRCEFNRVTIRRWFDQCNTVLSQRSRPLSAEWMSQRIHHLTEQSLEKWMVGKVIGTIENGLVVVVINGDRIEVMPWEIAEKMRVYSFGYSFTLKCDIEKREVSIRSLHHDYA